MTAIARALKRNTALTTLFLCGNSIVDEGANDIAHALEKSTALQNLNLSGERLWRRGRRIQNLHLGNNFVGDEGGNALLAAMVLNSTVTTRLSLSGNGVDMPVYNRINALVKENKSGSRDELVKANKQARISRKRYRKCSIWN